jgi:(S)-ureidoglycine aminohydrolase
MTSQYYSQMGGHPPQTQLLSGRAIFTEAYAVIPKGVMQDIVTSLLPHWNNTRAWIIARPLSGFAETFSQYIMEVAPGGGSDNPEPDPDAECVLFFVAGSATVTIGGKSHDLKTGGYAYIPAGSKWSLQNTHEEPAKFHWIRKAYETVQDIAKPEAIVTSGPRRALSTPLTSATTCM